MPLFADLAPVAGAADLEIDLVSQWLLAASVAGWLVVAAWRTRAGRRLLPYEPRREVPWSGTDVLLLALAYVGIPFACYLALAFWQGVSWDAVPPPKLMFGASAIGGVLWIGLAIFHLKRITAANWVDLGWQRGTLRKDLLAGVVSLLLFVPPVYVLQQVLTIWLESTQNHPLVDALAQDRDYSLVALGAFVAVASAPFSEEFLFRVILQGWIERRLSSPAAESMPRPVRAWLPIVVSAAAFSLIHLGHGTAPIPLFFLALVLGYLYRQTHRLLPCLVVHAGLNTYSMGRLLVMLWQGDLP